VHCNWTSLSCTHCSLYFDCPQHWEIIRLEMSALYLVERSAKPVCS
jgi:hypothetical protein